MFIIQNDFFFYTSMLGLAIILGYEYARRLVAHKNSQKGGKGRRLRRPKYIMRACPVYNDSSAIQSKYLCRDFLVHNMLIPCNNYIIPRSKMKFKSSSLDSVGSPSDTNPATIRTRVEKANSVDNFKPDPNIFILPGCEHDGPAAKQMKVLFPDQKLSDIIRFLIARKGDVTAAAEMMRNTIAWRKATFPIPREEINDALSTKCFFVHGKAKDGTPILYFRGGLYDPAKATGQQYILAAAHMVEYALRFGSQITVIVHTGHVEGGANAGIDMNFTKGYVKVMSDNYPERLKRLVIFPTPWYGRGIWSCIKPFLDARTQEKILLLTCANNTVPKDLLTHVDVEDMPDICGGKCKVPPISMEVTFTAPLPQAEAAVVSNGAATGSATKLRGGSGSAASPRGLEALRKGSSSMSEIIVGDDADRRASNGKESASVATTDSSHSTIDASDPRRSSADIKMRDKMS